nr:MAG TPA: Tape measure domain protein [Caudoviricetes sp.]
MSELKDGLSFAASVSTDEFDAGIDHIQNKIMGVAADCESESARIQSLINAAVPEVDISYLHDTVPTLNGIGEAYAQIYRVIRENESAVAELSAEYARLTEECNKYANVPEKRDEYVAMRAQRDVIKENIAVRRQVIAAAKQEETALQKEEKTLVAAAKAAEKNAASLKQNETASQSLKQKIKALEMEAAALVEQYASEGRVLDQTKGRYREIIEELGRLRDIRGDIQAAGNVFANDENQIAGVIQGLTGLSGAFSAAQGAIGLFAGENERLNEIMLKVQSLMAITMGLQQIQQTLNKDSAFSLVTLNSLKKIWNKLMGESADAIADENAEIAENVAETKQEIAATETHEAVNVADSAATTANSKATEINTADKAGNITATEGATAATGAHTGAMTASTVATTMLSKAMRVLKMALISTGIGALVVLVGELVSWIVDLCTAEDEAVKHTQDLNKVHEDAAKTYIQEKVALDDNIAMCKKFNGSKAEEKRKVEELNSKYGDALGYYDSLEQWERVLEERGPAYCEMLRMKAVQQGLLNKYVEAYVEALEMAHKAENGEFDRGWYNPARWFGESNDERRDRIKKEAQNEVDYWEKQMKDQKAELEAYQAANHFDVVHIDPKSKTISGGGSSKNSFNPEQSAREQKTLIDKYTEAVQKFIKESNASISQDMINGLSDGLGKEITQIRYAGQQRISAWRESLIELARERKQMLHDVYMTKKGATESGWEQSTNGKKNIDEFVAEILGVNIDDVADAAENQLTDVGKKAQQMLLSIQQQTSRMMTDANQKYYDQFVNDYGTLEQKTIILLRQYTNALNSIPAEITGDARESVIDNIQEIFDAKFSALDLSDFKKSLNWDDVFGNLDRVSTQSLRNLKTKLQDFIRTQKDLSPEAAKALAEAIEKIDDKVNERNPFEALSTSFASLKTATNDLKRAQDAYNAALENGTDLEKQNAAAALDAARNAKQKALVDATKSIQAACGRMKEYIGVATSLSDMLSSFGVEIPPELSGFIEGIGGALDGLESIDLTKPVSIVTGAFKVIGGIGKAIGSLFNHDDRKEKRIQKMQIQVEELQRAYDNLGKSLNNLYSTDASHLLEQQNQMLEQQKVLIQNQIAEEKSKKHTDNDRIRQWEQQIEDINAVIAENKDAAIDAIFGEDLKSAIENFADAYADAWANGEDRAKSAKDVVRNMMRQMVTESIKAAIQSSSQMQKIRDQLVSFYSDGILSDWEQNLVYNMAEQLQRELDAQFGWADSLLNDPNNEREGAQKGIATASQDSVDENNARLTTIQGHTYTLVQGVTELNATANAMLDRLSGIERNTGETNDKLDDVQSDIRKMRKTVDDIQTQGLRLKK